jgi:branched-chain amino acid transport system ATP-binding protein
VRPAPLLEAVGVRALYGDYVALDGVSLAIHEGQFVSIVGPNGAGKTTLVNVLTGLLRPNAGTVRFQGQDIIGIGPVRLAALGMARSFQLVNVFPALTVAETIAVAVVSQLGRGRRLWAALARDAEVRARVAVVADLFGLAPTLSVPARTLSQGDKKLLDVASAFALRPQIILLDEPTSGVSTRDKSTVMETLVAAAQQTGIKAIIQVEHDMDIVFAYSHRIVALHQGRVLADSTPDGIQGDEQVVATVIGRATLTAGRGGSAPAPGQARPALP